MARAAADGAAGTPGAGGKAGAPGKGTKGGAGGRGAVTLTINVNASGAGAGDIAQQVEHTVVALLERSGLLAGGDPSAEPA